MQLIQAFNAQQYDPTQGVGSLPIGKHPVIVESSEVKANKANDGGYLQLNLRIIDGPQQGTTGAYRLNLYHSNQQTVEIAHRQLSAICHVIGVFQVTDSSQLHNLPFLIEVGPQKNDPQYTEVKKVFDMNGNEPGKAGAGAAAAQPQQQQPQGQPNGAWGGAPQGQPQQPAGGAAWGGQQQPAQQPAQQPQGGAAWGGQPAQNPAPQGGQPAWGGQPAQQPAQQQPQGGGWQQGGGQPAQGGAPAGAAPWGQR
ncbi:single-stranded DNA-binding protein [Pseudomonas phage vB_PaeS_SCUT-S4]|nr:single-stranded DNA-binding protein [Pseudomonas phage vB_PaeS_SCUT-S4]